VSFYKSLLLKLTIAGCLIALSRLKNNIPYYIIVLMSNELKDANPQITNPGGVVKVINPLEQQALTERNSLVTQVVGAIAKRHSQAVAQSAQVLLNKDLTYLQSGIIGKYSLNGMGAPYCRLWGQAYDALQKNEVRYRGQHRYITTVDSDEIAAKHAELYPKPVDFVREFKQKATVPPAEIERARTRLRSRLMRDDIGDTEISKSFGYIGNPDGTYTKGVTLILGDKKDKDISNSDGLDPRSTSLIFKAWGIYLKETDLVQGEGVVLAAHLSELPGVGLWLSKDRRSGEVRLHGLEIKDINLVAAFFDLTCANLSLTSQLNQAEINYLEQKGK